jgi:hypothetical protein
MFCPTLFDFSPGSPGVFKGDIMDNKIKKLLKEANEIRDKEEMCPFNFNEWTESLYSGGYPKAFGYDNIKDFLIKYINNNEGEEDIFIPLSTKDAEKVIKEFEAAKEKFIQAKEEMQVVIQSLGEGTHFQDKDGVVYLIIPYTGSFKYPDPLITYKRTRNKEAGETKGSLSMSDARKLGYTVEGK